MESQVMCRRSSVHRINLLLRYVFTGCIMEYSSTYDRVRYFKQLAHIINHFVLEFTQAPIKTDVYTKSPNVSQGFFIPYLPEFSDRFQSAYELLMNLYGLKDAGKTWFDLLKRGFLEQGWKQSEIYSCLFTKDGILLVIYVDDAIFISPHKTLIDIEIKSLQEG